MKGWSLPPSCTVGLLSYSDCRQTFNNFHCYWSDKSDWCYLIGLSEHSGNYTDRLLEQSGAMCWYGSCGVKLNDVTVRHEPTGHASG